MYLEGNGRKKEMLNQMMKSVLDMDRASVVICDLNHTIIYMNPAAIRRHAKRGGNLVGQNLLACHNAQSVDIICRVIQWFQEKPDHNMIYTFRNEKENKDVYMVALRDENQKLIGYYEKHEYRDRETEKPYDFSHSLV